MSKKSRAQRRHDREAAKAQSAQSAQNAADLTIVREDGWINYITGMGLRSRDKTSSTIFVRDCFLTDEELTAMYLHDDLCARIIDAPVDEAFRRGFRLVVKDEDGRIDHEKTKELEPLAKSLVPVLVDKEKWSRLYGGSAIFLNVQDGGLLDQPLDPSRVKGVTSLPTFDRRQVWPHTLAVSPITFDYEPAYYSFAANAELAIKATKIHPSRFIFGRGRKVDRITRQHLNFWGESVLQPLYDTLRRQGTADKSALQLLMDASQFVFKLRGLLQALATGNKAYMETRLATTDMARGLGKAVAIDVGDKDNPGEGVERSSASFAGVADVLDRFQARLSAACGIPVSILFGVGPAGMNATGDMDMTLWYDKVRAYQETMTEDIKALLELHAASEGFDPEEVCIEWLPLEESSPTEEADIRLKTAQTDNIYFGMGLSGTQILLSRFGKGEYSTETEVDVDELESARDMPEMDPAMAVDPKTGQPMMEPPPKAMGQGKPAKADAMGEPRFQVGVRVVALVDHMPGMAGMTGIVTERHAGEPPYYAVDFGEGQPHKWLTEDELSAA